MVCGISRGGLRFRVLLQRSLLPTRPPSGVSGRVYSMMAKEMSSRANRGRILWILASSRPDLIEVDLKRPGRVDVKIPLFPCANAREAWALLRSLCKRKGVELSEAEEAEILGKMPELLTPGAAEAIAVKARRLMITENADAEQALADCLDGYLPPIALEVIRDQIGLAVAESSDASFIPSAFRD